MNRPALLLLVAAALAAAVALTATPASAQGTPTCANQAIGQACQNGGTVDVTPGSTNVYGGVPIPVDFVRYFDNEGTPVGAAEGYEDDGCWGIRAVPEGEGLTWSEAVEAQNSVGENGVAWGNCEVEETIDPEVLAIAYWQRVVVPPSPNLLIDPQFAVAGIASYLEIDGENPAGLDVPTPIGTLSFTMTPRYVVSWGDGASTPTTSQGGPWPSGDLTHTYIEDGEVTVTVDAFWTATWTLAGFSGDLPEHPVATNDDLGLPVQQYQAVIDPD